MTTRGIAAIGVTAAVVASGLLAASDWAGAARTRPTSGAVSTSLRSSALALPAPATLSTLVNPPVAGEGVWSSAGRLVHGQSAVYTTTLRLPDNLAVSAGVAWMDTRLLRARLYSGSLSPGGVFWKYTAPISPGASRTLVAAFSGGFLLKSSQGGYLSEGHLVAPLRVGAASLVIYRNGLARVGQWGRDVGMSSSVVAVRQNLNLIVDNGRPASGLNPRDVSVWGASLNAIPNTPRSGLGQTSTGALVYVSGPMTVVDLASLLVRAGAARAMVLDMNPLWPVFATYAPSPNGAPATPTNGRDLLATMLQSPARFFQPAYARDFITMSAL